MLGWGCVTRMGVLENVEVLGYHISNIELVLMGRLYRSFLKIILSNFFGSLCKIAIEVSNFYDALDTLVCR
jgi:hypothetical protein